MTQERPLRRDFLAVLSALPLYLVARHAEISLLPLYTPQEGKPVRQSLVDTAAAALGRVYRVDAIPRAPERYDGRCDPEALLNYLAERADLTMAVMGIPLHETAHVGFWSGARRVSGIADLPSDWRDRPRGSIITTNELAGRPETDVERWLGIVAIHEFGHNLGAWDCNDRACYMHYEIEFPHGPVPRQFCAFHEDLLERALRPTHPRRTSYSPGWRTPIA